MKHLGLHFLLFSCVFVSVAREAKAQDTLNALTPGLSNGGVYGPYIAGYVNDSVGWTFTPTEDVLVTAISSSAPQVSFWDGVNQILASFSYTGSSYSLESITPLLLSAGQNYSISMQAPNSQGVGFLLGSQSGANNIPIISVSSYLTGYGSFEVSANGQWTPFPTSNNSDLVFYAPNFQFQVVPEPSTISLSIFGFLFCSRKLKSLN